MKDNKILIMYESRMARLPEYDRVASASQEFCACLQMENVWILGNLTIIPQEYWIHLPETLRVENEFLWSNPESDFFPGLSSLISRSLKGENLLSSLQFVPIPSTLWYTIIRHYTYKRTTNQGEANFPTPLCFFWNPLVVQASCSFKYVKKLRQSGLHSSRPSI